MIGIGIGRADRRRVLARMLEGGGAARRDRETVGLKRPRIAARQPRPRMVMLEIGARPALAEGAEGVDITLARAAPADELDADLEARHRRAHEPGSEEHTSELQSLMRISYAVFCLKKKKRNIKNKKST